MSVFKYLPNADYQRVCVNAGVEAGCDFCVDTSSHLRVEMFPLTGSCLMMAVQDELLKDL